MSRISKFQHMLDEKFWHFWDEIPDTSIEAFSHGWDNWLEENRIRKVRYTEDGSGYSEVRRKYDMKATEHHVCCFNRAASIVSNERCSLLMVPYVLMEKSLVLGGLP
jgi:hypothetical protein